MHRSADLALFDLALFDLALFDVALFDVVLFSARLQSLRISWDPSSKPAICPKPRLDLLLHHKLSWTSAVVLLQRES